MATLRTTCTNCHCDVGLEPGEVLAASNDQLSGDYAFVCPACHELAVRPADTHALHLLRSIEVHVLDATRPPHPEAPPAGPALTLDDLIDLHQLMEDSRFLDRLTPAPRSPHEAA